MADILILLPEHCDHWCYRGWHLYLRERPSGRNSDGEWGWIRPSDWYIRHIRDLCERLGHADMPAVDRYDGRFINEYAARFPAGLLVVCGEYGRLSLAQDALLDPRPEVARA